MTGRILSKEQALEQLIVCRLRLGEALHFFTLWDHIHRGVANISYTPIEIPEDYLTTLRTAFLSWLASLIDKSSNAVNVFDVWAALFPSERPRIDKLWTEHKQAFELLRNFRNTTGFHGNRAISEHLKVREAVLNSAEVVKASQEFLNLAASMIRLERQSDQFCNAVKAKCEELRLNEAAFLRWFEYTSP